MQQGKQRRLLAGSPCTRARAGGGKRLESPYRCRGTSPGPQRRRRILPLSIQPKRASTSTNRAVRVHMSLNNSSINIQCFHYHQRRRGPPPASWEDAGEAAPAARSGPLQPGKCNFFFSHLWFRPSEDAACLIHESKTEATVRSKSF